MRDSDFDSLVHFKYVGGGFIPANIKGDELELSLRKNDIVHFKIAGNRDISMHRCYFSLLGFIHDYMPQSFKKRIPKNVFHIWLKHLKGDYETIYSFIDEEKISNILDYCLELGLTPDQSSSIAAKFGKTDMLQYDSISFGRMNQQKFKEYISNQLPYIYESVLGKYFEGEILNNIVETIEQEYERFMQKLF